MQARDGHRHFAGGIHRGPRRGKGPGAFSVVELLVVVAILSVLLAVLVPSLHTARGLARRAGCTANLRTMAAAFMQYAADSHDRLPDGMGYGNCFPNYDNTWDGVTRPWVMTMAPHLGGYGLGVCPGDREHACMSKVGAEGGAGHAYDPFFTLRFGAVPSSAARAAETWPWSYASSNLLGRNPATMQVSGPYSIAVTRIVQPARNFLLTELGRGPSKVYSVWYAQHFGYGAADGRWQAGRRHLGGRCFAFCDGHARWLEAPDPDAVDPSVIRLGYHELDYLDMPDGN